MNDLTVNGEITGTTISCNNITCDTLNGDLYSNSTKTTDVVGSINGDFKGSIKGDMTGNIEGDLNGNITGNVTGTIGSYKGQDILFSGNKITFTYNGESYTGYVFGY